MSKSYQSYMANINYNVSCEGKCMIKINNDQFNSMKLITKGMPMIGKSPNIPYMNEIVHISTLKKVNNVHKEWYKAIKCH